MVKRLEFERYNDMKEFQFDNGFDTTIDVEELKEAEENEYDESVFDTQKIYILNKDGHLYTKSEYGLFSYLKDDSVETGWYNVIDDSDTFTIINDDYKGFTSININDLFDELNLWKRKEVRKYNKKVNIDSIRINTNDLYEEWLTDYCGMSQEDIIEDITKKYKDAVREEIDDQLDDEDFDDIEDKDFTIIDENDNDNVWEYDSLEKSLLYKDKGVDKIMLKFKSFDYFKEKLISKRCIKNNIREYWSEGNEYVFKNEVSCLYYYGTDNINNDIFIDMDYENLKVDGISIPQSKFSFVLKKVTRSYKNKKKFGTDLINKLVKLSGIKVDVLGIESVECDDLTFSINFNLDDEDKFIMTFMGTDKLVKWDIVKKYMLEGLSISNRCGKCEFISMCQDFGIDNHTITSNINKAKMLKQLSGDDD